MSRTDSRCEITWEAPRFDGWYNSLGYPKRGAVGELQSCLKVSSSSSISAACRHTWSPLCVSARAGSHLMRLVPAHYWDGVYQPVHEPQLPNPRKLSTLLAAGPSGLPSTRNQTVLSLFFGKYIMHVVEVH